MRIDPKCRLEGLQRSLQVASPHMDHAKAAQRAEMTGFKVDHAGDVAPRTCVIALKEPDGGAFVPSLSKIGTLVNQRAEYLFGLTQQTAVHQVHAKLHQLAGALVAVAGDPSLPYLGGQTVGFGRISGALKFVEQSVKAWIGLVGGDRNRRQGQQQDRGS